MTQTQTPIFGTDTAAKMTPLDRELAMDRLEELAIRLPLLLQEIEEHWHSLKKDRPGSPLSAIKYNVLEVDLITAFLGIAHDTAREIGSTFEKIKLNDEMSM